MTRENDRVLVINPGSTSTKFGVFRKLRAEFVRTIRHSDEDMAQFRGRPQLAQLDYRAGLIASGLDDAGYAGTGFAAVAGRGGFLPPVPCGTYLVDDAMLEELRLARRGDHASNLGAPLALQFAKAAGVQAYVVDPVTVDEWQDCARLSGLPLAPRTQISHVLNTKAVARRFAREQHRDYESMRLIVLHLGSGITVSAHRDGRMIDNNACDEGPFGADRSGSLPARELVKLCFSGNSTESELDRMVFGAGGVFAYLGTRDLMELERRVDAEDEEASAVFNAMIYQVAKEAGAMAAVLQGKVDAVLVTGGMAHWQQAVAQLRGYLDWIAPIKVYPGEDELQALAEGVFRVLDGAEHAMRLRPEDADEDERRTKMLNPLKARLPGLE